MPLSDVDTSVLTRGEWQQVRCYGITTLGGVLKKPSGAALAFAEGQWRAFVGVLKGGPQG